MASPALAGTIAKSATGATNTTSFTITMPGSIAAGDGIIVKVSWDGNGTLTVDTGSSSSGWAKLGQTTNGTACTTAWFWQPNANGTSDALVISSTAAERGTALAQRVTGQSTSITPDYVGTSGAAAANAADPPNVTVTGGSKDILVMVGCTLDTAGTVPSAAPTNYTTGFDTHTGAASSVTSAWGSRQLTASSADAGVFTHASQAWTAEAVAIHPAAGATDYPVDAQPGSHVVTGTAASLLAGRVTTADPAAYVVTGSVATLARGLFVAADPGSYAVTGAAATLAVGYVLSADPGAYTITGADATLEHEAAGAYDLDAQPGTFAVTGADATFLTTRILSADPASYAITGVDAGLDVETPGAYTLNAEIGAYAVTGTAASVIAARLFNAEPATYTITGNQAQVGRELTINAQPGSVTLTGVAATFLRTLVLSADTGTYTINGAAAELRTEGQAPNMDEILTGWIAGPAHGFTGGGSSGRLRTPTTGSIA